MNQHRKPYFAAAAYLLTLVSSLFWVALRINYSGISKFLGADTKNVSSQSKKPAAKPLQQALFQLLILSIIMRRLLH